MPLRRRRSRSGVHTSRSSRSRSRSPRPTPRGRDREVQRRERRRAGPELERLLAALGQRRAREVLHRGGEIAGGFAGDPASAVSAHTASLMPPGAASPSSTARERRASTRAASFAADARSTASRRRSIVALGPAAIRFQRVEQHRRAVGGARDALVRGEHRGVAGGQLGRLAQHRAGAVVPQLAAHRPVEGAEARGHVRRGRQLERREPIDVLGDRRGVARRLAREDELAERADLRCRVARRGGVAIDGAPRRDRIWRRAPPRGRTPRARVPVRARSLAEIAEREVERRRHGAAARLLRALRERLDCRGAPRDRVLAGGPRRRD